MGYVRRSYRVDPTSPRNYHLVIDSTALPLQTVVDLVVEAARARGMRHPHAVRVLARAWAGVIWRCWQDAAPYDPACHGALNRYLSQDAAAAA